MSVSAYTFRSFPTTGRVVTRQSVMRGFVIPVRPYDRRNVHGSYLRFKLPIEERIGTLAVRRVPRYERDSAASLAITISDGTVARGGGGGRGQRGILDGSAETEESRNVVNYYCSVHIEKLKINKKKNYIIL